MLVHNKEKEAKKSISVSTNIERKPRKQISNKLLGAVLIILALWSLVLPETQEDGTAFVMMLIIGISALFSK
mgnify:FL=1